MKRLKRQQIQQNQLEEILNASTHGIGALLGITALVLLTVFSAQQGQAIKIVASVIYGVTLIILYSASSLYHIIPYEKLKSRLKVFDHVSIYLLIAGSYTPFTLVNMNGPWGWSLFGVIWGLALFGVVFKLFFTGKYELFSVALYVIMGWLILIAIKPMIHAIAFGGLIWLVIGGACYTLGVIFYLLDEKYYFSHFVWHLFVLAGSICHFFAVLFYVVWMN